jgi:hypothetical protein
MRHQYFKTSKKDLKDFIFSDSENEQNVIK